MQVGLLWFDNDPRRALSVKVTDAATRYREKFGSQPDTCYVNQTELNGPGLVLAVPGNDKRKLRVVPAFNILPSHFWVGEEDGGS
jgi:hypothetical protein